MENAIDYIRERLLGKSIVGFGDSYVEFNTDTILKVLEITFDYDDKDDDFNYDTYCFGNVVLNKMVTEITDIQVIKEVCSGRHTYTLATISFYSEGELILVISLNPHAEWGSMGYDTLCLLEIDDDQIEVLYEGFGR